MRIKWLAQEHYYRSQLIRTGDPTIVCPWSHPLSHDSSTKSWDSLSTWSLAFWRNRRTEFTCMFLKHCTNLSSNISNNQCETWDPLLIYRTYVSISTNSVPTQYYSFPSYDGVYCEMQFRVHNLKLTLLINNFVKHSLICMNKWCIVSM